MNDLRLSADAARVAADAVLALLDGGTLALYAGERPGDPDRTVGEPLVTLRFAAPAFKPAIGGVAASNPLKPGEAKRDGTADWFRAADRHGRGVFDGTVGVRDCDLSLNTVALHAGARVSVESLTYTQPQTS